MANRTVGLAGAKRGFVTVWALAFLAMMTVIMSLMLMGQSARHQTTERLIRVYRRETRHYREELAQRLRETPTVTRRDVHKHA